MNANQVARVRKDKKHEAASGHRSRCRVGRLRGGFANCCPRRAGAFDRNEAAQTDRGSPKRSICRTGLQQFLSCRRPGNAVGLLKEELRQLGSALIAAADRHQVPAGGALAVDREDFSASITAQIRQHPLITVQAEELTTIPAEGIVVIATGPLTQGNLFEDIARLMGTRTLHFFDAAAPIVTLESLDRQLVSGNQDTIRRSRLPQLPDGRVDLSAFS